jgi:hypothetical protein
MPVPSRVHWHLGELRRLPAGRAPGTLGAMNAATRLTTLRRGRLAFDVHDAGPSDVTALGRRAAVVDRVATGASVGRHAA